jgi:hypothetical protein
LPRKLYKCNQKLIFWSPLQFLGLLSYIVAGLSICVIANGPWGKHNLGSQAGQRVMIALIVACQAAVAMPAIFG